MLSSVSFYASYWWNRITGNSTNTNDSPYEPIDEKDHIGNNAPKNCSNEFISRQLFSGLLVNVVRDFVWTAFTYLNYDEKFKEDSDTNEDMLGQLLWTTVAMAMAAGMASSIIYIRNRNSENNKFTLKDAKEAAIATIAASAAVITWDKGQTLGVKFGKNLGLSDSNAGYFSSLLTGGLEGPTQYLAIFIGTMLLLPDERRERYTNNLKKGFLRFCCEMGWSIFPGSIPGGVWQLVYNWNPLNASTKSSSAADILELLGGSAIVSTAVGSCNLAHAKITEVVFGRLFDNPPEIDNAIENLDPEATLVHNRENTINS